MMEWDALRAAVTGERSALAAFGVVTTAAEVRAYAEQHGFDTTEAALIGARLFMVFDAQAAT